MTTTLTDRYVDAVVRSVPEKQRADLDKELRASIADAVDDRLEAGADAKAAEYDTILELGDPIILSAGYTGQPLHLIGPKLYADWKRLTVLLEFIVVPIVLVVLVFISILRGDSIGTAIGGAIWTTIVVGTQIAFWTTAIFALVERMPEYRDKKILEWTPEMLPETAAKRVSRGEFLVEAVLSAVFITALLLVPYISPFSDASGDPIPLLDPWIWSSGLIVVLVVAAVLQMAAKAIRLQGRYTLGWALGAIAVDIIGAAAVIVIGATGHVLNPAFVAAAGWPEVVATSANISAVVLGALTIAWSLWENLRAVNRRG